MLYYIRQTSISQYLSRGQNKAYKPPRKICFYNSLVLKIINKHSDGLRFDGLRADVNIYGVNRIIEIVNLFDSYPLLSCKQDEFKV